MRCAWNELLTILPPEIRCDVDRIGRKELLEVRLRIKAPAVLVLQRGTRELDRPVNREMLQFVVSAASQYSPWAASSVSRGYLTAAGGHRIGLCGEVVCRDGLVTGIREITSLCIRVARDVTGLAEKIAPIRGSVLILGAPGWGKTTLLRDLLRRIGETETVGVVDERGELFPEGFSAGRNVDILTGCPKTLGIGMLIRTMGPQWIGVDEITEPADCATLIRAANCGVHLAATAHGASLAEYRQRTVYQQLVRQGVFETAVCLRKDQSFTVERIIP